MPTPNQRMKLSWRGGGPLERERACLDSGRRTTQLMRDSLGIFSYRTHGTTHIGRRQTPLAAATRVGHHCEHGLLQPVDVVWLRDAIGSRALHLAFNGGHHAWLCH